MKSLFELLEVEKEKPQYQIYCDMDGVLCDFDAQFDHYYGKSPREYASEKGAELMKNAVDEVGEKYWSDMPWFPNSEIFWEYIADYSPIILTSPSKFLFAEKGKIEWVKKNLFPRPANIIFKQTGNKHSVLKDYDPKKCILIDDYFRNMMPWKEMGGIGITFRNAINTISILEEFGL